MYAKRPQPGVPTSEDLASIIPSNYSRKMNQMVAHETQDLYWFRNVGCPSPVGGGVALLVFICSVIGAVAPSYVVDGVKENEMGS
jgi:hypothetical protein